MSGGFRSTEFAAAFGWRGQFEDRPRPRLPHQCCELGYNKEYWRVMSTADDFEDARDQIPEHKSIQKPESCLERHSKKKRAWRRQTKEKKKEEEELDDKPPKHHARLVRSDKASGF